MLNQCKSSSAALALLAHNLAVPKTRGEEGMKRMNYITNNEITNIDMLHTTVHINISAGSDAAELVLVDDCEILLSS